MTALAIVAPTDAQLGYIASLCREHGLQQPVVYSKQEATEIIDARRHLRPGAVPARRRPPRGVATMSAADRYGVLVTLRDSARPKWLTAKRIHAATWNREGAETIARDLVELNPAQVTAAKAAKL